MSQVQLIFEKQWLHASSLAVCLVGLGLVGRINAVQVGQLWGVSTATWLWLAVALAIAHQVFVWVCWRSQLHASLITRMFGSRGFDVYASGFSILGIARVVAVFILAISNRDTLHLDPRVLRVAAMIVAIPAIYLFYSVKRYFGFKRAFGIDHFDKSYRSLPFVRKGIFRFTRNGMYIFGFLSFLVPGLWFASAAALIVALFNHLYIWIHYYSTELPYKWIYGESRELRRGIPICPGYLTEVTFSYLSRPLNSLSLSPISLSERPFCHFWKSPFSCSS
jgi:protein-S-isoprenylcysteine O-methyltransferase Ste14